MFEQKQKGLRYTILSQRLILRKMKRIHLVIEYLPEMVFPFLSRQNRHNIDKSSWNSFLPVLFTINPQETLKKKYGSYISKFKWATNCGILQRSCRQRFHSGCWFTLVMNMDKHNDIKRLHIRKLTQFIKLYHLLVS